LHYEAADGDLVMWNGDDALWCEWTVEALPSSHRFMLEPVPGGGNRSYATPFVAIKEDHPGADICFAGAHPGKRTGGTGFPEEGNIHLPRVDDAGDQCPGLGGDSPDVDGEKTFTINVSVDRGRGGPLWLRLCSDGDC